MYQYNYIYNIKYLLYLLTDQLDIIFICPIPSYIFAKSRKTFIFGVTTSSYHTMSYNWPIISLGFAALRDLKFATIYAILYHSRILSICIRIPPVQQ